MSQLHISTGQYSDSGRKPLNQDFHGVIIPEEPLLAAKGIAVALADGISSSDVSQLASESSVKGFFEDYYSSPESWSVKTSVQRVLRAMNSWLYAQTRGGPFRYEIDRGYVCTFCALVLKSTTAHLFHVGDARVYRLFDNSLEQLTEDHRLWMSRDKSYLSRALGMRDLIDIDYYTFALEIGDVYVMATDGVYEFVAEAFMAKTIQRNLDNLDLAAKLIVDEALQRGSDDNLTIQIVRVDGVPQHNIDELHEQASALPFPPVLQPRMDFDGYRIVRELHNSNRSHVYLAVDSQTNQQVVLKTPSVDLRDNAAYLERFLMEEWVARRIDNVHVLKPCEQTRKRNYLYITTEFIEGQTLTQWMTDNPEPNLETVRNIVEQIARGLQALHRQEMLHQDLRPNNIMIDSSGTVKLIDFGSVRVAGLVEISAWHEQAHILGTAQYAAPEYFLGEVGSRRSDLFSLGVITYQMLTGDLPYGVNVARTTSRAAQRNLRYRPISDDENGIPAWIDEAIRKAVHPDPNRRYDEISEFTHDLRQPNPVFLRKQRPPLMERNPLLFWKALSMLLLLAVVFLVSTHPGLNR
jgi:serine/threonine protein phosphatase PrpC/predicted Ser/Thr protein kinase